MKPITENQAADLAIELAARFDLSVSHTSLLVSFARRMYCEGRLSGTIELGEQMKRTIAQLDNVGRRKGNLLRP